MRRLTITHILNLVLGAVALGLFAVNQWHALAGEPFDLHGHTGAWILTVFLAAGIVVQLGKFVEGHRHWFQLLITCLLLGAHILAEMIIWYRTQISFAGLPEALPRLIVGLYWLVGVADVLSLSILRELKLLRADYTPPEELVRSLELQLAVAQQSQAIVRDGSAIAFERDCPRCGRTFVSAKEKGATYAVNAHLRTCQGNPNNNGHKLDEFVGEVVQR